MSDLLHHVGKRLLSVFAHNATVKQSSRDSNSDRSGGASANSDSYNLPPLRRIVTGHDANGQGSVKWDNLIPGEEAAGLVGCRGLRSGALWTTETVPSNDTNNDTDGAQRTISGQGLVMRGGTNLRFTDLAPGESSPMHRTSSIDYNILVFGKLILINDTGPETLLSNPGDTVIMRGTMHAWKNPGPGWARWVSVLVDAEPAVVNGVQQEDAWIVPSSS